MDWIPELRNVVTIVGLFLCLTGMVLCFLVTRRKFRGMAKGRVINLGVVSLSVLATYKLLAFAGFVAIPVATVGVANYHVFEGVKEVNSCMQCHVMRPMVNDMWDSESETLAARHYANKWIPQNQCYACHTDYGLAGSIEAKMDGFRHLARYTTGLYEEPITFRGIYKNQNCLQCHSGTRAYESISSHAVATERLTQNQMSCLNCHGQAHPTRAQRTPDHPDYKQLMEER